MNIGSGMILDRTIQPKVRDIEHLAVQMRIDLLMEGARWPQ